MKKIFLFAIVSSIALSASAQGARSSFASKPMNTRTVAARTTAIGDIDTSGHIFSTDTLAIYYAGSMGPDSGYITGMNAYGSKGFAERFSFSGGDSSVSVLGLLTEFTGSVSPTSTKTVVFNAWNVAARTAFGTAANTYNSGLPGTSLTSLTVPVTQLGISTVAGGSDTVKAFMFATPSAYVPRFFIGYTIAYTPTAFGGDTLGVLSNLQSERHYSYAYLSGTDTIVNNVNATQYADGTWHDNGSSSFGLGSQLFFFPIFKIGAGLAAVNGITNNNLTIFNNYPNPATTNTNIKFAVAKATEVTITISDMTGKTIQTIKQNCNAGTQVVNVNTEAMAAGNYIYLIRTEAGEGMASQLSVIK